MPFALLNLFQFVYSQILSVNTPNYLTNWWCLSFCLWHYIRKSVMLSLQCFQFVPGKGQFLKELFYCCLGFEALMVGWRSGRGWSGWSSFLGAGISVGCSCLRSPAFWVSGSMSGSWGFLLPSSRGVGVCGGWLWFSCGVAHGVGGGGG